MQTNENFRIFLFTLIFQCLFLFFVFSYIFFNKRWDLLRVNKYGYCIYTHVNDAGLSVELIVELLNPVLLLCCWINIVKNCNKMIKRREFIRY